MKKLLLINIILVLFVGTISAQHGNLIDTKTALAKRYEQEGQLEKAKQLYGEILEEQQWNFEIVRSLNDIFLKLKEYDNSILLLKERLNLNSADPNLYGMLGATYATMGDNKKASEVWDEGIEKTKGSLASYRVIAEYAIQKRDFEKAIEILKKGKEIINDPTIFTYDLGNLYTVTMNFEEAADIYSALLLTNPEQIGAVQSRMNRYLTHPNSIKPTIETAEDYFEKYNLPIYLDLLKYLYTREENYAKAFEVILKKDNLLMNNGNSILNFAREVFKDGDYETSEKAFDFLIENYKSASFLPDAELGKLRAEEEKLNNQFSDSSNYWKPFHSYDTTNSYKYYKLIKNYDALSKKYFKDNIVVSAKMRIALIQKNIFKNLDEAENIFSELFNSRLAFNFIPQILENLADISVQKNNLSKAENLYKDLNKMPGVDPAKKNLAYFMSAKISFWKGRFTDASRILGDIARNLSDNYANDAIELSIIINTLKKDSLNLLNYANGDLLAQQNKFDEASKVFKNLADNKRLLLLNDIAKYKYAQMQIALENYDNAINSLEELSGGEIKNVYSDKALFLLGNTYLYALNNDEQASSTFQKLLDTFPNSLYFEESRELLNIISKGYKQTI